MKILAWNIRGFNHPLKQREVVGRVHRLNPRLVCLLETRIKEHKMQEIFSKQFPGWKLFHNYSIAHNGRIWFLWKDSIQVSLISLTNQSITCRIEEDTGQFYFSAIYGCNTGVERQGLWNHLQVLNRDLSNEPWMMAGDFNVIAQQCESSSRSQEINVDIRDFVESKNHLSMFDHAFSGPLFTWTNRQAEGFIAKKLDRVLINGNWSSKFPQSQVEFLPQEISDHCPALIQLQQESHSPPKPFKFFNHWVKHQKFLEVVEQSWCEAAVGNPMKCLHQKMKRLKNGLRRFNQLEFGNISAKVTQKMRELAELQVLVLNSTNDAALIEMEKKLTIELNLLLQAEESYYRQKS